MSNYLAYVLNRLGLGITGVLACVVAGSIVVNSAQEPEQSPIGVPEETLPTPSSFVE